MKIIITLIYFLFIFNITNTYGSLAIEENCNSSPYYNQRADICGRHSLRLYPGQKFDFPDYWIRRNGFDKKERILQASSSQIQLLNFNSIDYNISYSGSQFSSNRISAEADTYGYTGKKPVVRWLYGLGLDLNQDITKLDVNKPVARIDRTIVNYIIDNTGDIRPGLSEYKYCTVNETVDLNGITNYSACNFVPFTGNTWSVRTRSTLRRQHIESYLIYPAWCGDGAVSHGEACDPGDTTNKSGWGDLGCSSTCSPINSTLSGSLSTPPGGGGTSPGGGSIPLSGSGYCGDGVKSDSELCDPGDTSHTGWGYSGCSATCNPIGYCGDGVKSDSELCDPGDTSHTGWGDLGCSSTCNPINSTPPSGSGYCGDGILQRPNSDGLYEECDFGGLSPWNNWKNWCGKPSTTNNCKILESSVPSGGDIQILPSGDLLIGHNMSVFGNIPGSKVSIKNNSLSDIYIDKKLCLFKYDIYASLSGPTNVCFPSESTGVIGRLNKSGGFKEYIVSTEWKGNIDNFGTGIKFTDNKIITKIEGVSDTSFLASTLNVRVAKSTLATIGGGASFLNGNNLSDLNVLSNGFGVLQQPKNKNFILTSIGKNPLSSFVKTTSNSGILNISKNDENASLNSLSNLIEGGITSSTIYSLPTLTYNNLDNVFIHNGDVILNSQTISGNKTYIINGNLTINGNITSGDNILFVVKNGDLTIGVDVEKIDAILINIGGNIKSNGNTLNRLIINGALYGNVSDLLANRTYIKDRGEYVDVGTNINFTSKIFTNPPPLLSKFLKEFTETQKIPR